MTTPTPLQALIEKLETAKEGSRKLDAEIFESLHDGEWRPYAPRAKTFWFFKRGTDQVILCGRRYIPAYTTSLDAALQLVPEGWKIFDCEEHEPDNWSWFLDDRENPRKQAHGWGRSIALALCIASLKARLSLLEKEST